MPKVTIAVAVYNSAKHIEECVRSLYQQTLDDIEILLVDDCSPDDSIDISLRALDQYPRRRGQVRVIRHNQNQGISATKRDAFLQATGDYVVVIDGDDFVAPHFAEQLHRKAVETGAGITICDFYNYKDGNKTIGTLLPNGIIGDADNVRTDIINRRVAPFMWCKLFRRGLLSEYEYIWPVKNLGEDTVISTETAYFARRIAYVDEPLYYYRYNPNAVTRLLDEDHCLENHDSFKSNVDIYVRFLEREGMGDRYGRGIFINKVRTKNRLLPIVGRWKYIGMWLRTYPEVNRVILFGNKHYHSTYRERVWFFAVVLGLYPLLRRRLYSKRFFPCREWV